MKISCLFLAFLMGFNCYTQNLSSKIKSIKSRPLSSYTWDLSTLYADASEVDLEIKKIDRLLSSMAELKQLELKGSEDLLRLLDEVSDVRKRAAKLVVYGALISNLDKTSVSAQKIYDQALEVEDKVESAVSFMKFKIAALAPSDLEHWIIEEPRLQAHIKRVNRIQFEKPYFLDPDTERSLKQLNRFRLQSGQTYQALMDANLNWPMTDSEKNENQIITPTNYLSIRRTNDTYSSQSIEKFHRFLAKYDDLLAIQLTKRIEMDLQLAQLRGFESGIDMEFYLRDGFPVGTVAQFRKAAQSHSGILSEYVRSKSEILGNDTPRYADLYRSAASYTDVYPIQRSVEIIFNATKKFGTNYQQRLVEVFNDSVLHFASLPTKRRMWAIYPPVGGAKPYTIMSYDDSFLASNVFSRAMVGNLTQHHYQPDTRDDPPVYNNGVIYTGSLIHYEYLIDKAKSDKEKSFYLIEAANRIWNSFFKYAIYATFEFKVEERLKSGKSLRGEDVSQVYYDVLRSFFDDDIQIPEHYKYEWMTIAQPFYSYEHQYWPVAIAASSVILDRVEKNQKIQQLLIGKTNAQWDRSYQILKEAGINMGDENTYQSISRRMKKYLSKLRTTLNNN